MKQATIIDNVSAYITRYALIPHGTTIIVGLSGGPDSMFLLHALSQLRDALNIKIIAAHFDHEWRPTSSDDLKFCQKQMQMLDVELVHSSMSKLGVSLKFNGSREELGRRARRVFFDTILKQHNAHAVALAHHADDQQETFFIRLLRGTSLSGLTGIQPKHGIYIRPLLSLHKKDIVAYLDECGIKYLIDPTNAHNDFLRNRLRNTVLPALRTCDKRFDSTFFSTLSQLQETEQFLEKLTEQYFKDVTTQHGKHYQLDIVKWSALDRVMQNRILMLFLCKNNAPFTPTHRFFNEMHRFLITPSGGTHTLHTHWSLTKQQKIARILFHAAH